MLFFNRARALVAQRPECALLIGPEELLAEALLLGAHGGVSGGANVNPRLYVELYEAAGRRDLERVNALHRDVTRVSSTLYRVGVYESPSAFLNALKTSLSCLGICNDFVAEPFERLRLRRARPGVAHLVELGLSRGRKEPVASAAGR